MMITASLLTACSSSESERRIVPRNIVLDTEPAKEKEKEDPFITPGDLETLAAARDSDGDSLENGWELYYAAQINLVDLNPSNDLDNDGVSNLDEFLLGTNPLVADADFFELEPSLEGTFSYKWFGVARLPYILEVRKSAEDSWHYVDTFYGYNGELSFTLENFVGASRLQVRFRNNKIYIREESSAAIFPADAYEYQKITVNTSRDIGALDKAIASLSKGNLSLPKDPKSGEFAPTLIRLLPGHFLVQGTTYVRPIDLTTRKLLPWKLSDRNFLIENNWTLRGSGLQTRLILDTRRPEFSGVHPADVGYVSMILGRGDEAGRQAAGAESVRAYHNQKILDLSLVGNFSKINRMKDPATQHPVKMVVHGIAIYGSYSVIERVELRDLGTDHFGLPIAGEVWSIPYQDPPGESFGAAIRGPILSQVESGYYFGSRIAHSRYIGPAAWGIPSGHLGLTTIFMVSGGMKKAWFNQPNNTFHFLRGGELIGNSCLVSSDPAHLWAGQPTGQEPASYRKKVLEENRLQCLSMYQTDGGRVAGNYTLNVSKSYFADTTKAKNFLIEGNTFVDTNEGILFQVGAIATTAYENIEIRNNKIFINIENGETHRWGAGIGLQSDNQVRDSDPSRDNSDIFFRGLRDIRVRSNELVMSPFNVEGASHACQTDRIGIYLAGVSGSVEISKNLIDSQIPDLGGNGQFCNSGKIRVSQIKGYKDGNLVLSREMDLASSQLCENRDEKGTLVSLLRLWEVELTDQAGKNVRLGPIKDGSFSLSSESCPFE